MPPSDEKPRRRKSQLRKRPNGDGSVFQLPDGSWRVVVSCGIVNGKRIRRTRHAKTREAAKAALADLMKEIGGGISTPTEITVAEWMQEWIDAMKAANMAENSILSYQAATANHITPNLGGCKLADLTTAHIDAAFRRMKCGARTKELVFTVLSTSLRRAVKKGMLAANPCAEADRPTSTRKRIVPIKPEDVKRILAHLKSDRLYAAVVIAFALGMRQGELFGLRWTDIDFKKNTLTIHQQACEVAGRIVLKKPKTDSGHRTIAFSDTVAEALRARRAAALKEGNAACDLVFCNERGGPVRRSNFGFAVWRPALKSLGLKHHGFHITRHTAASLMLGAGVPVHVVSKILGHANPSITLKLYAHLMEHQAEAAAKIIDEMIG